MKKAFTLAEILIALMVVGIIAALTIPPVVTKYQKKMYATSLQKEYNKISEAIIKMMEEENVSNFYESKAAFAQNEDCSETTKTCSTGAGFLLNNYFDVDVKKSCASKSCLATSYKTLGDNKVTIPALDYCIRTIRGSVICGYKNSSKMRLVVDLNGVENPNVGGRDLFYMDVENDGSISASSKTCTSSNFEGCVTKIMDDNWVMEY